MISRKLVVLVAVVAVVAVVGLSYANQVGGYIIADEVRAGNAVLNSSGLTVGKDIAINPSTGLKIGDQIAISPSELKVGDNFTVTPTGLVAKGKATLEELNVTYSHSGPDFIVYWDGSECVVINGHNLSVAYTSTSNTTAINWAIANAPSPGVVKLSSGKYFLDSAITIGRSDVSLVGEGWSTVLQYADRNNAIRVGAGIDNVTLADFKVVCTESYDEYSTIYIAAGGLHENIKITNLWVENSQWDALDVEDTQKGVIADNVIIGGVDSGITLYSSTAYIEDMLVTDNYISGVSAVGATGIYGKSVQNSVITDNIVKSCYDGFELVTSSRNCTVANNKFVSCSHAGIVLNTDYDCIISNNDLSGDATPLSITGGSGHTIYNNKGYTSNNIEGDLTLTGTVKPSTITLPGSSTVLSAMNFGKLTGVPINGTGGALQKFWVAHGLGKAPTNVQLTVAEPTASDFTVKELYWAPNSTDPTTYFDVYIAVTDSLTSGATCNVTWVAYS